MPLPQSHFTLGGMLLACLLASTAWAQYPTPDPTLFPEVFPEDVKVAEPTPVPGATAVPRPAVLRMDSQPEFVWIRRPKDSILSSIKVIVRNTGQTEAQDIRVSGQLGKFPQISLTGPSTLAPNQTAVFTYSGSGLVSERKGERVNVHVSCANCRK